MQPALLIGTTKGAFILSPEPGSHEWRVDGPHCDGWTINHVIGDEDTGAIYAGGGGAWEGAGVWASHDGGRTWEVTQLTKGERDTWAANDPEFAAMIGWTDAPLPFGEAFQQIWSLCCQLEGQTWKPLCHCLM